MPQVEFTDVSYTYPNGVEALRSVDFSVEAGGLAVLMGENGSGKTTVLKHLNGLLKPTRGRVTIDGLETRSASVAQLSSKVGLVFQNAEEMFFEATVADEVGFALRNFGFRNEVVEKRVRWALNFLELESYAGVSPFMLSGGEKKRLALAIVLAWGPSIIAMDEPTIGQDSLQKEKLAQMVRLLNAQGKTVIMASHDVEFVADIRPRVILLSKGKVVAEGEAHEILTDVEKLSRCSLLPPQVVTTLLRLADAGASPNIIDVESAAAEVVEKVLS